jgi:hypothetical protein
MLTEVDDRAPEDTAFLIDVQSHASVLVKEGQSILPFVLSLAAFANARNLIPAHQRLNAERRNIEKLPEERGVDTEVSIVPFQLHLPLLKKSRTRSPQRR